MATDAYSSNTTGKQFRVRATGRVMKLLAITFITVAIMLITVGIMFITEVITCVRTEASHGFPSNKFVNVWGCMHYGKYHEGIMIFPVARTPPYINNYIIPKVMWATHVACKIAYQCHSLPRVSHTNIEFPIHKSKLTSVEHANTCVYSWVGLKRVVETFEESIIMQYSNITTSIRIFI